MKRIVFIDAARGAAILLVLVGHGIAVPEEKGFDSPDVLVGIWNFFDPFRMPMLLFLSGVLLPVSLKKSPPRFLVGKFRFILWPYVIWAIIRYLPDAGSTSVLDPDVWLAAGYLWFLFFLCGYYLIALALKDIPFWVVTAVFLGSSFVLDGILEKFVFHAAYFFAGAAMVTLSPQMGFLRSPWVRVTSSVVALITGTLSVTFPDESVPNGAFPAVLCCIFAALALFQWLEQVYALRFLQWIGRNSIVFYTSHMPAISMVVTIWGVSGLDVDWVIWIIGTAVALTVGMTFTRYRSSYMLGALFEAPRWSNRGANRTLRTGGVRVG